MGADGQTTLTTYYVVPPTSGCNGSWAFGPFSALYADCTGPYTYVFDPFTCVDMSWGFPPFQVSGDTMYAGLCSLPCTFQMYADTGLCMQLICGPIPLSIEGHPQRGSMGVIVPNLISAADPDMEVLITEAHRAMATVLDASGKALLTHVLGEGSNTIDLRALSIGHYVLLLADESGRFTTARFSIQ